MMAQVMYCFCSHYDSMTVKQCHYSTTVPLFNPGCKSTVKAAEILPKCIQKMDNPVYKKIPYLFQRTVQAVEIKPGCCKNGQPGFLNINNICFIKLNCDSYCKVMLHFMTVHVHCELSGRPDRTHAGIRQPYLPP